MAGQTLRLQEPHMRGSQVRALQQALMNAGIEVIVDGDFGPQTEGAVKEFQRRRSLLVDGIVGPVTGAALGLDIERGTNQELLKSGLHPDASAALRRLGITSERIMQTIGSASASAGTHEAEPGSDGGQEYRVQGKIYCAAVDLRSKDLSASEIRDLLENLAREGFAAWDRHPGRDGWPDDEVKHIHAVYTGCAMKGVLRRQVQDYLEGKNGLASHRDYDFFSPSNVALRQVRDSFQSHTMMTAGLPSGEIVDEDPAIHDDHKYLEDDTEPI